MPKTLSRLDSARVRLEHKFISEFGYDTFERWKSRFLELEFAIDEELKRQSRRVLLPGEPFGPNLDEDGNRLSA